MHPPVGILADWNKARAEQGVHARGQIRPAQQVMRQHESGQGDALVVPEGCDVDDDPEIEVAIVETRDQPIRGFADHGKYPDGVGGCGLAG
jgi:hypothetical protein